MQNLQNNQGKYLSYFSVIIIFFIKILWLHIQTEYKTHFWVDEDAVIL